MPYVTAGHPSLDATRAAIPRMAAAGADIIELGIPFSDPIADGPVIAAAMHRALKGGARLADVFELVRAVREETTVGLVAMVSDSIIERIGGERFVQRAAQAGFDGLIVPDIDVARAASLAARTKASGMAFAMLVAPTTPSERLPELLTLCSGFVYVLARLGITGERADLPDIAPRIEELRRLTDLPLAIGFGISNAEHVAHVTEHADAAIVGSALVRRMESEPGDPAGEAARFVEELSRGVRRRET